VISGTGTTFQEQVNFGSGKGHTQVLLFRKRLYGEVFCTMMGSGPTFHEMVNFLVKRFLR